MSNLIATFFGIGHLRPAPGTWGSAAAILPAWVIHGIFGPLGLLIAISLAAGLGFCATQNYICGSDNHDPSEVVIDEVVGQWIALLPLSFGLWFAGAGDWVFPYPGWVCAFLAFRLFDIWKPGPVGWADRQGGAWGVMLDDIIAGILAGLVVVTLAAIAHLVIM